MITIYGRATSSNVQAVMWLVGELGLSHERIDKGHSHGGLDDPEYRKINPHGLVPALKDGEVEMFESSAILRYLAAKYGADTSFWDPDPAKQANADKWAEWGKTTFCPAFSGPIFWARVRTPAQQRNQQMLARAVQTFEALMLRVGMQLEDKPYLLGDEPTLADIVIGHLLYRYYDIDIQRSPRPRVRAYYERLAERPAFKEHVMVNYDVLRAQAPDPVRLDVPDWLWGVLADSLGDDLPSVLEVLRHRAPVHLRCNIRRQPRDELIDVLRQGGYEAKPTALAAAGIEIAGAPRGLANLPSFLSGAFELQDAASQAVVERLGAHLPGAKVLDFCAGGGGKTLAMAAFEPANNLRIINRDTLGDAYKNGDFLDDLALGAPKRQAYAAAMIQKVKRTLPQ